MRHRRHTLRATALLPCVAVLLVTPLTSAASDPGARSGETRDPISDARTTSSTVADPLPQGPVGADESGVLPVRILMSGRRDHRVRARQRSDGEVAAAAKGLRALLLPRATTTPQAALSGSAGHPPRRVRSRATPHRRHTVRTGRRRTQYAPGTVRHGRTDSTTGRPQRIAGPIRADAGRRQERPGRDSGEGRERHHAGNGPRQRQSPPDRHRLGHGRSLRAGTAGAGSPHGVAPFGEGGRHRGGLPVLPLGAGLTSIGLGLALLALRSAPRLM